MTKELQENLSKKAKSIITLIEEDIRESIKEIGVTKFANIVGLKQPDVSNWGNNKIYWSYEKLMNIADKYKASKN